MKLCVIAATFLFVASGYAAELTVPGDHKTIQQAINAAQPGDVVLVGAGSYDERLTLREGVTVRGEERDAVRVTGELGRQPFATAEKVKGAVLENLTFRPSSAEENQNMYGSLLEVAAGDVTARDCLFAGAPHAGLLAKKNGTLRLEQCEVTEMGNSGIVADGEGAAVLATDSRIFENVRGLYCHSAASAQLTNCEFTENEKDAVEAFYPGTHLLLEHCEVLKNGGTGIWMEYGAAATAGGCTIQENGTGVHAFADARIELRDCVVRENQVDGTGAAGIGATLFLERCTLERNGGAGAGAVYGASLEAVDCHFIANGQSAAVAGFWETKGTVRGGVMEGHESVAAQVRSGATLALENVAIVRNPGVGIYVEDQGSVLHETGTVLADNLYDDRVNDPGLMENQQAQVFDREVGYLLATEQFDKLERLLQRTRELNTRYTNGNWQLAYFYNCVDKGYWETTPKMRNRWLRALDKWQKAYPESVAPYIARARTHSEWAFDARGTEFADKVTDKGWKGFRENMDEAERILEEAEKLDQKDVTLYQTWITVGGLGQNYSHAKLMALAEKGNAISPGYIPMYELMMTPLMPRWGGSLNEMKAFADKANAWCGPEQGDQCYAVLSMMAAWSVTEREYTSGEYFDWERVDRGFEQLRAALPDSWRQLNQHCYMACRYQDKERAKELFELLGDNWNSGVWFGDKNFRQWKRWATFDAPMPKEDYEEPDAVEVFEERIENTMRYGLPLGIAAGVLVTAIITLLIVLLLRRSEKS